MKVEIQYNFVCIVILAIAATNTKAFRKREPARTSVVSPSNNKMAANPCCICKIGPSILNADLSCLADECNRLLEYGADYGKISAQPHTIIEKICFPNGNVLFLSLFSLSKNWMHYVVWGCAEILPRLPKPGLHGWVCVPNIAGINDDYMMSVERIM